MAEAAALAARLLRLGANGYAGFAASLMVEADPDLDHRYDGDALPAWRSHLLQRVEELAAALAAGEPRIFVTRVVWTAAAFRARGARVADLSTSLEALRTVLNEKLPADAAAVGESYVADGLEALGGTPTADAVGLSAENHHERLALEYLEAALEGDRRRAVAIIDGALDAGLGVRDAYTEVLVPALHEVGRLWHQGHVSVAEEHLITATTERVIALLAHRAPATTERGLTVLVAAVEGNAHDIGPRVVADFFELDGWRALYLGADVPTPDLVGAVQRFGPDVIVLSASMSTQLETLRATIEQVMQGVESAPPIVVGGQAFRDAPDLWRQLGARAFAETAEDAPQIAAELLAT